MSSQKDTSEGVRGAFSRFLGELEVFLAFLGLKKIWILNLLKQA
jgi:hypothetical protein